MSAHPSISEYTESEFVGLVEAIYAEGIKSDRGRFQELLDHFNQIFEHPEKTDLIFYSSEEDCSPKTVTEIVKEWLAEQGKPGFKPSTED